MSKNCLLPSAQCIVYSQTYHVKEGKVWMLISKSQRRAGCVAIFQDSRSVACGKNCSESTTGIPRHLRKTATKRTKAQCPLSYLSTTSMGTTGIEDKQKRPRQNIFPLIRSGTFLQCGIVTPS
jgi:hypothetical protein